MDGKGRFIFPVLISALIVFVVSAVVTFTNIGLRVDFVPRWLKAFITGWPVAAHICPSSRIVGNGSTAICMMPAICADRFLPSIR